MISFKIKDHRSKASKTKYGDENDEMMMRIFFLLEKAKNVKLHHISERNSKGGYFTLIYEQNP